MSGPEKKPVGRPRKRPETLVRLRCDVTPEEAERVREAAGETGRSVSDLTRDAVVREADRILNRKKKPRPKGK